MDNYLKSDTVLGILGGGQLGRMLLQKATDFNVSTCVMDPDADAPCKYLTENFVHASFKDADAVYAFGKKCTVITVEIEHVNVDALEQLEREGKKVFPQPAVLRMVQDKGLQKIFYRTHKIPTAEFYLIENKNDLLKYSDQFPFMQKLRTSGYDGKGVTKLLSVADMEKAFDAPSVLEKLVDFEKEISVIVARNENGEITHFPPVEMEFNAEANLVEFLFSPASLSDALQSEAIGIAKKIISEARMIGVLAVEMFVTKDQKILVNEIAPRPHNSGHQTIEGNVTSQYEQHLRAILNLPLGNTDIVKPAVMVNLLGEKGYAGVARYEGIEEAMKMKGVYIHLYGKKITKPFRKMGHVTVTADTLEDAKEKAVQVKNLIKVIA